MGGKAAGPKQQDGMKDATGSNTEPAASSFADASAGRVPKTTVHPQASSERKKLFPMFSKRGQQDDGTTGKTQQEQHRRLEEGGSGGLHGSASQATTAALELAEQEQGKEPASRTVPTSFNQGKAMSVNSLASGSSSSTRTKQRSTSLQPIANASPSRLSTTPPRKQPGVREIIEISDSPVKDSPPKLKTLADFAAERKANKRKPVPISHPLWPSNSTIHVRGDSHCLGDAQFSSYTIPFDIKGKGRALTLNDSALIGAYPSPYGDCASYARDLWPQTPDIVPGHNAPCCDEQPLRGLNNASKSRSDHWPLRYAPATCEDILGAQNRDNARYLKSWLQALAVEDTHYTTQQNNEPSPMRKRKIQREVTAIERKRSRRNERRGKRRHASYSDDDDRLEDFVAGDDEELDYYDDVRSGGSAFSSPAKSGMCGEGHIFEHLSNLIVISGPVSSGKTATVHAVALELGWQIFEVYPGIGKRGAKDLERYVGMVGDNHLVNREAAKLDIYRQNEDQNETAATGTNKYRQSLILIEEVDILYPSDAGFWEGLVALVAGSKRPVVLTCNDPTAIPQHALPIQTILFNGMPGREPSNRFLAQVAAQEEAPFFPIAVTKIDLRHELCVLQGGFQSTDSSLPPPTSLQQNTLTGASVFLRGIFTALENASFADGNFKPRSSFHRQDDDIADQSPEDLLQGNPDRPVRHLPTDTLQDASRPLPCFSKEDELVAFFPGRSQSAQVLLELPGAALQDLSGVIDTFTVRLGSTAANLEYLPYLRDIVATDDEQQACYREAMQMEDDDIVLDSRVRRSRRLAGTASEPYRRYWDLCEETHEWMNRVARHLCGS